MCFPCLFCLLLYLHRYCTCFLINLNFDLFVLYHFTSISIPLVFLDLVVHFGVPFGYLPVDILVLVLDLCCYPFGIRTHIHG